MDIHELLAKVTDDSGRAIAKKVGLAERTVPHQISTGRMPLDNVIKITAAYGYSPIRALIDLGELDATWSQVPDVEAALRLATDEQLTDKFLRRTPTGTLRWATLKPPDVPGNRTPMISTVSPTS